MGYNPLIYLAFIMTSRGSPSLEKYIVKGNDPKITGNFRSVNYYNIPRKSQKHGDIRVSWGYIYIYHMEDIMDHIYPLVISHNYGKSPFIVDFPRKNGGSFHNFCVNVYQRVSLHFPMVFLWFSH